MNKRSTIAIPFTFGLALVAAACGGPDAGVEAQSWESFLADATRTFEGETSYVVEGDQPVTLEQLRERYEHIVSETTWTEDERGNEIGTTHRHATVNQRNGADDVWSVAQARNLTYCISNDFGGLKQRVVNEMAQATADWEEQADVDFIYDASHDGNCSNANGAVLFSVRPWNQGGGCAFFPSGAAGSYCVARTLVMDFDDFDNNPAYGNVSTLGVFRHELGHILGLRHEHIRVAGTGCSESGGYRTLTSYDSASVMHYPWCPGATQTGDLVITGLDARGVDELYPLTCSDQRFFFGGPYPGYTQGRKFVLATTYLGYPVYQMTYGGYTFSIYRRGNGRWYLDFDGVDESWSGTIAYSLSSGDDAVGLRWNSGAVADSETVTMSGAPYSGYTSGTWTLADHYNGSPVYQRTAGGVVWSLYRRNSDEWYVDFDDVDESWNGTVAYTIGQPKVPAAARWNGATDVTPVCD